MNRIEECFVRLRAQEEKALIAFLVAGDPSFDASLEMVCEAVDAGADLIEIGMPFSEAMADGPVIQRAYGRALAAGMTLGRVLEFVRRLRGRTAVPILLMGYTNPVLHHGVEAFAADLKSAGGDGALIVDLPPEESGDLNAALQREDLAQVFLLSPTSDAKRLRLAAKKARGFLYYISLEGTTGGSLDDFDGVAGRVVEIRRLSQLPVAVGFGIRTPAQVRTLSAFADAVVVGSALIESCEGKTGREAKRSVRDFIAALKAAQRT